MQSPRFHLSFPVLNIPETKAFYGDGLGCAIGRETEEAVILNLYGHQLVAHVVKEPLEPQRGIYPRHFGLVFQRESEWEALLQQAQRQQLQFYQQPKHRFSGSPLEHRTFFLRDPSANLLEFKYYCHESAIFGDRNLSFVGDQA